MPTIERIESWHGQDVLDGAGEKAGRLEDVYYDPTTHEPVLVSVKHGMLGRQVTLIPAAQAVLSHDYLRVPYSAEQIQHAESASDQEELSSEQVAGVGVLFDLRLPSGRAYYFVCPRRREDAPNVLAFRTWIKQEAAAMDWEKHVKRQLSRTRRRAEGR